LGKVWIQIISTSSCQFKIGIIFLITLATLFLSVLLFFPAVHVTSWQNDLISGLLDWLAKC